MKRKNKAERMVTIPLAEYEKMQDDIECLTATIEAQIEAMHKLADKIRKLETINAEIKGKYSALWQMVK